MSRCLSERSIDHVVLERGEIAHSWRTERWDSLRLLTPNWQSRLPGYQYEGADPDGYMTMREVIELNRLTPPYALTVGQRLRLPTARFYTVQRGDTMYGISRMHQVGMSELARANGLQEPYAIRVGQQLQIPGAGPAVQTAENSRAALPSRPTAAPVAPPVAVPPAAAPPVTAPPTISKPSPSTSCTTSASHRCNWTNSSPCSARSRTGR